MFTNCVAKAKLQFNKKLKTYKLIVAFVNNNDSITQRNASFVSGDMCAETLSTDIVRVLHNAQQTLRTKNIVIVE
jgi:hypothetical protein